MTTARHSPPARPGDWLEAHGVHGETARRGQIVEVIGRRGHERYRTRWDEMHESIVFPADGVTIVPASRGRGPAEPTKPFRSILCAIDGSRGSGEAVREALALCDPAGAVRFVAVTDVRGHGANRMASLGEHRAGQALSAARALARDRGVRAEVELVHDDDAAGALLERAAAHDLLAVGSHPGTRLAGIAIGSVATEVVHRAVRAVLVARRSVGPVARRSVGPVAPFPSHVVVAVAPTGGEALVESAGELAVGHGANVHLVSVGQRGGDAEQRHRLAGLAVRLRDITGVAPVVSTPTGAAPAGIVDTARADGANLIVVGRRGLTGVAGLGSVSERVVHTAPCSVLILPPPALAA